jgi:hypothetical protein
MKNNSPILITGSHRSGTTWVSKIVAGSSDIRFLNEPFFNLAKKDAVPKNWFLHITSKNESEYYEKIRDLLSFSSYFQKQILASIKGSKNILKHPRSTLIHALEHFRNIGGVRPLVKEPIGVFSAEWLASKFNMDVIIMIRHPLAFAGSLKDLDWQFNFRHFLEQPLLMEDYLYPFGKQIKEYVESKHDIIDVASLLWKSIYHTVAQYKKCHKDWLFVRHEDISRNPVFWFKNIFEKCKLKYTPEIEAIIKKSSDKDNPSMLKRGDKNRFSTNRNSEKNVHSWKNRLTPEEIDRVMLNVQEISRSFYDDTEWE